MRCAIGVDFEGDPIYLLTKFDRWFLQSGKEIVETEENVARREAWRH
jgi:hypothetical protein